MIAATTNGVKAIELSEDDVKTILDALTCMEDGARMKADKHKIGSDSRKDALNYVKDLSQLRQRVRESANLVEKTEPREDLEVIRNRYKGASENYSKAAARFYESANSVMVPYHTGRGSSEHAEGCEDSAYNLQTIVMEIEDVLERGSEEEIAEYARDYEQRSREVETAGQGAWYDTCYVTGRLA